MGLWEAYRASLKSPEVEEPIDLWVHRPLAYVLARACFPLPISPDAITVGSILLGWAGAACLVMPFEHNLWAGGLLILASTVFDCADGQLARMRKTSSVFGRMLDGTADLLVMLAVVPATIYRVWLKHHDPLWLGFTGVGLSVATVITSSWHTVVYDYYKNIWMRFTTDGYKEGESYTSVRARYDATQHTLSPWTRFTFWMYLLHVSGQENFLRKFDPHISLEKIPTRSPETEAIFREEQTLPWSLNRGIFGFGSLMFGLALSNALDLVDVFLLLRLVVLNVVFLAVLRPMQRRASQALFARLTPREA
jgi:phosphatidylglycerophosphate synthase